jgi:hypothetical protein
MERIVGSKPQGFVMGLIGKPGSGKTTKVRELLSGSVGRDFDHIAVFSPSHKEYHDLVPKEQCIGKFDLYRLRQVINFVNSLASTKPKGYSSKLLIVLDDVIADVKKFADNTDVVALFFNRRHLLWEGSVSIVITTQKYTMMPAKFRSCLTALVFFSLSPFDLDKIYDDSIIIYTKRQWKDMVMKVYSAEHACINIDLDKQLIS